MLNLTLLITLQDIKDILYQYIFSKSFIVGVLDILVVWYLIYKLLILIKGTKAVEVLKGIAIILIVRSISDMIGLNTVSWIMEQVINYGVIASIIIFQPEIRRGLEHIGRGTIFQRKTRHAQKDKANMINSLDHAIQYMSKRKIGALITIERQTGLAEYIETGIPLNANISGELLINIFIPNTPLHDGAVIIRRNKVAAASAYLPLSENDQIPKEFGTRHRAAIGISEVTDSITIVVSEETGDVSIARAGRLNTGLTSEEYLKILNTELIGTEEEHEGLMKYFVDGFTKGANKDE